MYMYMYGESLLSEKNFVYGGMKMNSTVKYRQVLPQ